LNQSQRDPVNVIFLDINLPRMTGAEFLNAAIEQFGPAINEISVFLLTTSTAPADRKLVDDFEFVKGYLNKPLTIEHLEEVTRIVSSTASD
jgi:response regulator RpfG family c-di-GMP phosphodiesterase